jgi:hypothetical protein
MKCNSAGLKPETRNRGKNHTLTAQHGKEFRVVLLDHNFICIIANTLDTF